MTCWRCAWAQPRSLLLPFCRDLPRTVARAPAVDAGGDWRRAVWRGGVHRLQIRPGGARRHSAAGHAAVLVTALLWLALGERPTHSQLIGLAGIALGVLCVALPLLQNRRLAHAAGRRADAGGLADLGGVQACWCGNGRFRRGCSPALSRWARHCCICRCTCCGCPKGLAEASATS